MNNAWKKNGKFKEAALKMILAKNYGVEVDLVDVHALMDVSLTISENLREILKYLHVRKRIDYCPCCERIMRYTK